MTNECVRCRDEYESYNVLVRDDFAEIAERQRKWELHEGDRDGLCKPCRMAVADYGAYLTEEEREELEPKTGVRFEIFESEEWPHERIDCVCGKSIGAPKPQTECGTCGAHYKRDQDEALLTAGPI